MTRFNISVKGLDSVMKDFSEAGRKAQDNADKVTETYTRKMANEGADMAPVDTSALKNNLLASPRRISPGVWEFGGTLAYTRRQEYEHKTKKGFIRKAVWRNRNDYREKLREELARWE